MRTDRNYPRPTSFSDYQVRLFAKLGKILTLIIGVLLFEHFFGVPALRVEWSSHGSADPRDMAMCEVVSLYGERRYSSYEPLVTIIRDPKVTFGGFIWKKIRRFYPF